MNGFHHWQMFFFVYPYFSQSLKRISHIIDFIVFFQSFNLKCIFLFSAIFYYFIYKLI